MLDTHFCDLDQILIKMTVIKFVFVVALLLAVQNSVVEGAEMEETCKNVLTELMQAQIVAQKECMEEMKAKSGQKGALNMMCVLKCSLQKEGFLDKGGNVDLIGSMQFLDKLPQNVKEKALPLFMDCQEHMGKVDPTEESCKSYGPLLQCCQVVIGKLCYIGDSLVAGNATDAP